MFEHKPGDKLLFGAFELRPAERLLLHQDVPVTLGSRAMDILLCLIERSGGVMTQDELLDRVWRGVSVEPVALRVHVSALRKALREAEPLGHYISSVAGRGYCFVAPIVREAFVVTAAGHDRPALPPALDRMIGRETAVDELTRTIVNERFVAVVGPGGIGKTTAAVALAHRLSGEFAGDVVFVDLSREQRDANVASAVAAAFQLSGVRGEADVASRLGGRRLLLILDSCEHVIASAAALAECVFEGSAQVSILATSREPLNARGEYVYRLAALEVPPPSQAPSFEEVYAFPAARLFVERVLAGGGQIQHRPADALLIAGICRKLDGIPLAIELAAGRVDAFGLATTLALLDSRLRLSWAGRRTAAPRHVTLSAALDWSYDLLCADEARLLRSLSAFAGAFTLGAAEAVVGGDIEGSAVALLSGLVSKSLVNTVPSGSELCYRLLDTTRVYGAARFAEAEERRRVAVRHGAWALNALRALLDAKEQAGSTGQYAAVIAALAEARGALAWALLERNDLNLGVRLAAAAVLAMLKTSQFTECRRCAEIGLAALSSDQLGGRVEMELQIGLGLSRMLGGDNTPDTDAALGRSLELADRFNELGHMIPILSGLQLYHHRGGDARLAMAFAERAERVAMTLGDPASLAVAQDMLAVSHHLNGAHERAAEYAAAVLRAPPPVRRFDRLAFGLEHRNRALALIARVHWLNGRYQQAVAMARRAVDVAEELEHPASKALVIAAVLPIFLWIGDRDTISDYVERLSAVAEQRDIGPHRHIAEAFRGADLIQRGDSKSGIEVMRRSLYRLEESGNRQMPILLGPDFIHGLIEAGDPRAAQTEVDRMFRLIEVTGCNYNIPEFLRVSGEIARRFDERSHAKPGALFLRALATARHQNALAWALRTSIALLELRYEEGRPASAKRLVSGLLSRFSDRTETPDRAKAVRLLHKR